MFEDDLEENDDVLFNEQLKKDIENNPFLMGGYGVTSFFSIHSSLWRLFMALSVMFAPIFYIYMSGTFLKEEGITQRTFLGNLGGSSTICKHRTLQHDTINLQCDDGFVLDTARTTFGVISNEFTFMGFCHQRNLDNKI